MFSRFACHLVCDLICENLQEHLPSILTQQSASTVTLVASVQLERAHAKAAFLDLINRKHSSRLVLHASQV